MNIEHRNDDKNNSEKTFYINLNFEQFSALESFDSTNFKNFYVDICDNDLVAGILLSKIIYWFGNSKKDGESRAKIKHEGRICLIKKRTDWWEECRISPKQYDRAIKILKDKKFVEVEIHKSPFNFGETACFIFVNKEVLLKEVSNFFSNLKAPNYQSGNPELPKGEFQKNLQFESDEGRNPEFPKREFQNLSLGKTGITEKVNPIYTITTNNNLDNINNPLPHQVGTSTFVDGENSTFSNSKIPKNENPIFERKIDQDESIVDTSFLDDMGITPRSKGSNPRAMGSNPRALRTKRKNSIGDKIEFGPYKNVLMTQADYEEAIKTHGKESVDRNIEELDLWLGRGKGKGEKDHYLTLLTFIRKEKQTVPVKALKREKQPEISELKIYRNQQKARKFIADNRDKEWCDMQCMGAFVRIANDRLDYNNTKFDELFQHYTSKLN